MMKVKKIYFSPTGNCKKIISRFWEGEELNIQDPAARERDVFIEKDEVLVISMPIYASRLPNKIMPFIRDKIKGEGKAVCLVSYGNRSYGDGLAELVGLLKDNGLKVVAAGAIPSPHAFADIGKDIDIERIDDFVKNIDLDREIDVSGSYPPGPYYRPLKEDGEFANFLKAKPVKGETCTGCGLCEKVCPMAEDICIKCQACVVNCPVKAMHFEDPDFLSHKAYLEKNFNDKKDPVFY
ncbi:MAG: hypothetical protein MJ146_03130 [Clostridia bacterium]|nr:hypothetical protein [Clostridia bacterium]